MDSNTSLSIAPPEAPVQDRKRPRRPRFQPTLMRGPRYSYQPADSRGGLVLAGIGSLPSWADARSRRPHPGSRLPGAAALDQRRPPAHGPAARPSRADRVLGLLPTQLGSDPALHA